METHKRSIVKALTWRAMGAVFTTTLVWVFTGRLGMAATLGIVDTVLKLGAYYVHERLWNRISFGRDRPPEYQI